MNLKNKGMILVVMILVAMLLITGCSEEASPYQVNDAEGYSVSVKFDANGGYFGTNTYVIVDAYNVSEMKKNSEGNVEIALLSPDNEVRGIDAYTAQNPGYFLAGWYAERTETAEGYTYGKKWDFQADRLTVNPAEVHSAETPVVTLYAVWVPKFQVEFIDLDSGELLSTYEFNPSQAEDILVPAWDEETGAVEMYDFPEKKGYTFAGAYYDAAGTQAVDTPALVHPGVVNEATGAAENATLQVYVDWTEGEWYRIYTAEQFLENASVSGSYEICADLDFEGMIWPTSLVYGNFSGSIIGNGHTLRNITVEQTNNSKTNAGLFGYLTETAAIQDLTFENVSFTVKAGTRVAGTSYGLLAGSISGDAVLANVAITSGQLLIDATAYFGTDDYTIGLLCGMGSADIDIAGITCQVIGEGADALFAVITDGTVTLSDDPADAPVVDEAVPEETAAEEAAE